MSENFNVLLMVCWCSLKLLGNTTIYYLTIIFINLYNDVNVEVVLLVLTTQRDINI